MTETLLILLVLVELARLVLQYRSIKTYAERQEKTYDKACKRIKLEQAQLMLF